MKSTDQAAVEQKVELALGLRYSKAFKVAGAYVLPSIGTALAVEHWRGTAKVEQYLAFICLALLAIGVAALFVAGRVATAPWATGVSRRKLPDVASTVVASNEAGPSVE